MTTSNTNMTPYDDYYSSTTSSSSPDQSVYFWGNRLYETDFEDAPLSLMDNGTNDLVLTDYGSLFDSNYNNTSQGGDPSNNDAFVFNQLLLFTENAKSNSFVYVEPECIPC
jgi:hypothetical protein